MHLLKIRPRAGKKGLEFTPSEIIVFCDLAKSVEFLTEFTTTDILLIVELFIYFIYSKDINKMLYIVNQEGFASVSVLAFAGKHGCK
jgi:hypothetical protein